MATTKAEKTGGKPDNKHIMEVTEQFMTAVMKGRDWHPYAQLRTRKMKAAPNIPAFSECKVIRTHNPGGGYDPDVCRSVFVRIKLGGDDRLRLQTMGGRLLVVKECEWDPCQTCEGKGVTDGDVRCVACGGAGKRKVEPARIPTRGTKTYEYDLAQGEWGVCPTSFSFVADSEKVVE